MQTYIYKTSVNIGYVIDYVIKERKSLNGADSTIQKASNDKIYIYIYTQLSRNKHWATSEEFFNWKKNLLCPERDLNPRPPETSRVR